MTTLGNENPAGQESAKNGVESEEEPENNGQTPKAHASGTRTITTSLPTEMPNLEDDSSWDELPSWVRKLRNENARRRTKEDELSSQLTEVQQKLTQLETVNLSEDQKELVRLKKLESDIVPALEAEKRKLLVQIRANELGVVDSEAVVALLDWKRVDKGEDVEKVLKELLDAKPYLKKTVEQPSNANSENESEEETETGKSAKKVTQDGTNAEETTPKKPSVAGPGNSHRGKVYTRQQFANMSPDEINELYDNGDLKAALQEGRVKTE